MQRNPEITITSDDLRDRVEDKLDRMIPAGVWTRAEAYARRKIELYRQRWPEAGIYDDDYLVELAADTVRETELADLLKGVPA